MQLSLLSVNSTPARVYGSCTFLGNFFGNFCSLRFTLPLTNLKEHFLTQEGEFCAAIHEPFVRFDLVQALGQFP